MSPKKTAQKKLKNLHLSWDLDLEDRNSDKQTNTTVKFLPLYFPYDLQLAKLAGCPYTAISILTGEDPFKLRQQYKYQIGLSPKVMVNHFVERGFALQELTKRYLYSVLMEGKLITEAHVILASLRMTAKESSWVVMHGGVMWHNYHPTTTNFTTSMSFPMEYGYRIYTPYW